MSTLESFPPLDAEAIPSVTIRRRSGWQVVDWRELYLYRDLFRFLILREIKVRYAQSAIGVGWAIIQPTFSMLVFTIVFGRLAKIPSDGVPYALFSLSALVPWIYFSNALTDGANSSITNANMLRKVYFPRMLMPMSAVAARLVDFMVAFCILSLLMLWYGVVPTFGVLMIPWLLAVMFVSATGTVLWLAAFAVQYRDVKHAMSFIVQILMYAAPVVYPASRVPDEFQSLYAVNPMVGVIEGFRSALLATRPMPWQMIAIGSMSALLLAVSGAMYFRRKERLFADVA